MHTASTHSKDTLCSDLTATAEHVRAALCTCICLLGRCRCCRRMMRGREQGGVALSTIENLLKPYQLMLSNFHSQRKHKSKAGSQAPHFRACSGQSLGILFGFRLFVLFLLEQTSQNDDDADASQCERKDFEQKQSLPNKCALACSRSQL